MDRPGKRRAVVLALLPAVVFSLALPAGAQQPPRETRSILLGIYRADGSLTSGLEPQHITVKGVRARVVRVTAEEAPRRIVLLLDASGSIRHIWPRAVDVCRAFVAAAGPGDDLALHVFARQHRVLVSQGKDRAFVREALAELAADAKPPEKLGKQTYLPDALAEILTESQLAPGDVILIVSDGVAQGGEVTFERLRRQMAARGVRLFWLSLLHRGDYRSLGNVSSIYRRAHASFVEFTRTVGETGGLAFDVWMDPAAQPGDAPPHGAYERVMQWAHRSIRSFYRVELELEEPLAKPKKFTLEVRDGEGNKLPDQALAYPRHLLPLRATP